jgi:hypothetical protein
MATMEMLQRLPKLDDDDDVGVEKEYRVTRDNGPDFKFQGTLLASAAPDCYGQDRWREYRVYKTVGGTYVFSKIGRSVLIDERDKFEAETWTHDPHVRIGAGKAGGLREYEWTDAAVGFFKFDQLAKQLYGKLNIDSAERID